VCVKDNFVIVSFIIVVAQIEFTIAINCRLLHEPRFFLVCHGLESKPRFVSVYRVYFVSVDNIFMWIYEM
jgi:hypothetical protein